MRLNRAAAYALHALAHIAAQGADARVTAQDVAAATGVPPLFLPKVLKTLVRAGLLRSLRGPAGGYRLARPASKVTLLEVVEAVQGPVRGEVPIPGGGRPTELDARLQGVCEDVAALVRKRLARVRLSDLVEG